MFIYPAKAEFNRAIPKIKIYAGARPSKSVRDKFVKQVGEIVWRYKLSPETVNLASRGGFTEIQVFDIILRQQELDKRVLSTIDRAIPYPILYRLFYEGRVKRMAAWKRPAADSSGKWVTETYFETGWMKELDQHLPLPLALDIKSLYEQMLFAYIDLPRREGEDLGTLAERVEAIRRCRRDLEILKTKIKTEKQFNRKMELNAQARELQGQLKGLVT